MTVLLFIRCLLFICDAFYISLGPLLLGLGLYLLFNLEELFTFIGKQLEAHHDIPVMDYHGLAAIFPPIVYQLLYAIIVIGALTFLLGVFGCFATFQAVEVVLFFGLTVTFVLLVEFSVGLYLYYVRETFYTRTKESLRMTIATNYTGNSNPDEMGLVSFFWNAVMARFECCGVDSFRDFALSDQWVQFGKETIPIACCGLRDKSDPSEGAKVISCPSFPTFVDSNKEVGCFPYIRRYVEAGVNSFFGLLVFVCVLELITALFCCCICSTMAKPERKPPCTPPPCTPPCPRRRSCQCPCRYPTYGGGGRGVRCSHIYCHHDFCI